MLSRFTYEDFINKVNELGFMAYNTIIKGFPAVTELVPEEQAWSEDPETDAWLWKNICCEQKRLAYGDFFGQKGVIAPYYYPIFYLVYHPLESMEERHDSGEIDSMTWDIWNLFKKMNAPLSTYEMKSYLGLSKKHGDNHFKTVIKKMQLKFDITMVGGKQRVDKFGRPYGDTSNLYELVPNHVPPIWLEAPKGLDKVSGKEILLNRAREISTGLSEKDLQKLLKF